MSRYFVQRQRARHLRKEMTEAELKLWQAIRGKRIGGVQFYRQRPVGPFILDFWAPSVRLAVEVDGSQHLESVGQRYDRRRDGWLGRRGIGVLRFNNLEVLQEFDSVVERIHWVIDQRIGRSASATGNSH